MIRPVLRTARLAPRTPAIRFAALAAVSAVLLAVISASAQDANVTMPVAELERVLRSDPLRIVSAEISRPKAKGDITLKAEVAFGERPPMRVKLRKAEPGADDFNNVPRYDVAAYELQKFFLDPAEYVVPPTALRMLPRSELLTWSPKVRATFTGADEVLCVVQYWLQDVAVAVDVLDRSRFEADAAYARHVGQLNVLTYLIHHSDSNLGNFLISRPPGSRLFSVDNGVAFAAEESDRGTLWQDMRVTRLPADAVQRLRTLTEAELVARLGVLAQWELRDGAWVAVPTGTNVSPKGGVRRAGGTLQMGLTAAEIDAVWRRLRRLIARIDDGGITVVADAASR